MTVRAQMDLHERGRSKRVKKRQGRIGAGSRICSRKGPIEGSEKASNVRRVISLFQRRNKTKSREVGG